MGKVAAEWIRVRRQWVKNNPPDYTGYWYCYLCGKAVDKYDLNVDHVIPRSRAPQLRFDLNNLRPSCYICNNKKGSRVYEDL